MFLGREGSRCSFEGSGPLRGFSREVTQFGEWRSCRPSNCPPNVPSLPRTKSFSGKLNFPCQNRVLCQLVWLATLSSNTKTASLGNRTSHEGGGNLPRQGGHQACAPTLLKGWGLDRRGGSCL